MGRIRIMAPIYDDIRDAIEASDMSRYRMSKETGIGEPQLCLFMAGKKGLSVEALETLADCLGLEITTRRKRKKIGKKTSNKDRK